MKKILMMTAVLGLSLAAACLPGFAHHGSAAYETGSSLTFKAVVTEFRFINPHCQVFFDVKNDQGQTEHWQGELTAPNKLARAGWTKHTLNVGDQISVSGFAAKGGAHSIWIRKLIGADGQPLQLSEGDAASN